MPSSANKPATIEVGRSWSVFPGFLYGVRQPTMRGPLIVGSALQVDTDWLDRTIAGLVAELEYDPPEATGAQGLVMRVARLTAALQNFFEIPVSGTCHVEPVDSLPDGRSQFLLALPYFEFRATRLALLWAVEALNQMLAVNGASSSEPAGEAVMQLGKQLLPFTPPSRNMRHFIKAAIELDIPVQRMVLNVIAFGTGCRTRLLESTITERTSLLGSGIARNKVATATLFRRAGLPAPEQSVVATADEAVAAAEGFGYPVVVKPADQNQGAGVAAGLRDAASVRAAVSEAARLSARIIVEKHFEGKDYRLTVVDGEVVKIENRIPGGVTGDGRSSIGDLATALRETPRFRRILHETGRMSLSLDAEALGLLEEMGLAPDSIPPEGQFVPLRRKNNVSAGGEQILIPVEGAHPDNIALAVRAAAQLRVDFAGVDLLIADIADSWLETGALICEVNTMPQVGIRTTPKIYGEILQRLVGPEPRIPAHLLIVPDDRQPDSKELTKLMDDLSCNALSTSQGVWIDGERLAAMPADGFSSASIVLSELGTRGALCVVPAGQIAARGLPGDWFESIRIETADKRSAGLAPAVRPHTAALVETARDA